MAQTHAGVRTSLLNGSDPIGLVNDMLWGYFNPPSVFWPSVISVGLDNEDPLKGGDNGRVDVISFVQSSGDTPFLPSFRSGLLFGIREGRCSYEVVGIWRLITRNETSQMAAFTVP